MYNQVMPTEFICEEIKVEISEENPMEPISFEWRGKKYAIEKVKSSWQDWKFGGSPAPRRAPWRQRRHRNYFKVLTTSKEEFEIYYDRGSKSAVWILANRIQEKN